MNASIIFCCLYEELVETGALSGCVHSTAMWLTNPLCFFVQVGYLTAMYAKKSNILCVLQFAHTGVFFACSLSALALQPNCLCVQGMLSSTLGQARDVKPKRRALSLIPSLSNLIFWQCYKQSTHEQKSGK